MKDLLAWPVFVFLFNCAALVVIAAVVLAVRAGLAPLLIAVPVYGGYVLGKRQGHYDERQTFKANK